MKKLKKYYDECSHFDYEEVELQRVKWVGLLLVNNLITFKKFDRIEK